MINKEAFLGLSFSIAMTEVQNNLLVGLLDKGPHQEDLCFALWKPSKGESRYTAVIQKVLPPIDQDRILQGNVAFTPEYVERVLKEVTPGYGIAFLHSHVGSGWQGMSSDDIIAEQSRLASVVAGKTELPLVGMTWGRDGSWSGRFWVRIGRNQYDKYWAKTVRVVGPNLKLTYHPQILPPPKSTASQVATASCWGEVKQADLARVHVGIIGLGSVGSLVAEALSRMGISRFTLIDHDLIEERNLDRTLGTLQVDEGIAKVKVALRTIYFSHTAYDVNIDSYQGSLLHATGLAKALDCDILFSCVDRPAPRHMLNSIAYGHLIPVIDGGILANVNSNGKLLHVDWRIHVVAPGRPCMKCVGNLDPTNVALDYEGILDDPAYIKGLDPTLNLLLSRQNVFPFSMSVAAHEVIQFIGLVTGEKRVGGYGPQMYHAYPGEMEVLEIQECKPECAYNDLTGKVPDLAGNLKP